MHAYSLRFGHMFMLWNVYYVYIVFSLVYNYSIISLFIDKELVPEFEVYVK